MVLMSEKREREVRMATFLMAPAHKQTRGEGDEEVAYKVRKLSCWKLMTSSDLSVNAAMRRDNYADQNSCRR